MKHSTTNGRIVIDRDKEFADWFIFLYVFWSFITIWYRQLFISHGVSTIIIIKCTTTKTETKKISSDNVLSDINIQNISMRKWNETTKKKRTKEKIHCFIDRLLFNFNVQWHVAMSFLASVWFFFLSSYCYLLQFLFFFFSWNALNRIHVSPMMQSE